MKTSWHQAKNIQFVYKLLAQNGGEGRVVGGAVRDHLMGVKIGDIDFCSTHTPEQLIEIAKNNRVRYIETGVKYGTVSLIINGEIFEVTSLRQDVETDGRHATVVYGLDFACDALRRDFTFNALYMNADGEIFDPLGTGIADLKQRKIKFIGNASQRIEEDYLRILRYFRFIACYGFEHEQNDYAQIANLVTGLKQLSAERLLNEFKRIFKSNFLHQAVQLMVNCGIFETLFNEQANIENIKYLQKNRLSYDDIWLIQFRLCLPYISTKTLSNCIKLSNREQKNLNQLNQLAAILGFDDEQLATQVYKSGQAVVVNNLIHFAAETNFSFEILKQKLGFVTLFEIPTFPIKGADLFNLGFVAGPDMGKQIKQLETLWLESDFKLTKQQLLTSI